MKLFTLSLLATGRRHVNRQRVLSSRNAADHPCSQDRCRKGRTGFRASKIIGESVVNDANETVGKVDDIIVAVERRRS